jgi:hypothetical protein
MCPGLVCFCGDKTRTVIQSIGDIGEARERLNHIRGNAHSFGIEFYLGTDLSTALAMLTLTDSPDGGVLFLFRQSREFARLVLGNPPFRAADLFRTCVLTMDPFHGLWWEDHNLTLINLGGQWSAEIVPAAVRFGLPERYPEEAIQNWSPGAARAELFKYPDCVWWFNYWGSKIVDEIGRDLVLGMPAPHLQVLANDGVMFWLCDEFFSFRRPEHLRVQRQCFEYVGLREFLLTKS